MTEGVYTLPGLLYNGGSFLLFSPSGGLRRQLPRQREPRERVTATLHQCEIFAAERLHLRREASPLGDVKGGGSA